MSMLSWESLAKLNMTLQISESAHPLSDADISAFEAMGNIRLPDAYRGFLMAHNGGKPMPKRFVTLDKKVESMVAMFFPISTA
jgi:hypothetical protein